MCFTVSAVRFLRTLCLLVLCAATLPAFAAERLLFCNTPERIQSPGIYGETTLKKGETYRLFLHYRNDRGEARTPLTIAFTDAKHRPVALSIRAGIGEPGTDPTLVGRQAMARYLTAPRKQFLGKTGSVRIPIGLQPHQVASAVLSVVPDRDVRLTIYVKHTKWTVRGAKVIALKTSQREMSVALTHQMRRQYLRIGMGEPGAGTVYGMLYQIRVNAPRGSRVRIAFSPRGGHAGMVGMLNGLLQQSPIQPQEGWYHWADGVVGKDGLLRLTTAPFGGVFYPVELAFELLK